MNFDNRTLKFNKNVLALLFCQVGSIGVSFLLVPLTLGFLGITEYGIWITLITIIEWFNFFDIGLGHGLRNKYAEAKASQNLDDLKKYVSTTFFMMVFISIFIFLIFLASTFFVDWYKVLNASQDLDDTIQKLVIFLIGMFCTRFIINIVNVLLTADQNPAIPAFILLSGNVLSLTSIYLLIHFGKASLFALGTTLYAAQISPLVIAFFYFFSTKYKPYLPSIKSFSKTHLKQISSLGINFFLIQITALVLLQSNNIILAHVCGLKEVTNFNIAFKYVNILFMVYMTFLTPLWSASTDAFARNDISWITNTYKRLNNLWFLLILVGITMLVVSSIFYSLWLKNKVLPDLHLLFFLMINTFCLMKSTLYRSFMNSVGKIRLQFVVTVIQAILHIPVAIFLGKQFGAIGVACTMLIWNLINAIWEPIQFKKIITNTAKGIWQK